MRKLSKFLSGVLAFVMVACMLPTAAFATESGDPPTSGQTTAITVTTRDNKQPSTMIADCGIQLERVTSGRYENIGIQYTNASGSVTWTQLEPGWYRITQVSAAATYKENSTPIVRWFGSDSDNHLVTIENQAKNSLTIKRTTNGAKPVAGAGFEVRDTNNGLVASGSTDETGTLYIPNLAPGNYTVREVHTPTGVDPVSVAQNPQTLTVLQSDTNDYSLLFNSSEQPSLLIYFLDRELRTGVAGATFTLKTAAGDVIASNIKTDASGMAVVPNLEAGTYILTQTHVPDGYIGDYQSAQFTVQVNQDGNIIETFYGDRPGSVTILVADSTNGTPLAGAVVRLYSQGNVLVAGPSTTNGEGLVTFTGLESGNYTAVISNAPNGYTMDATTMAVTVKPNNNTAQVFTATIQASLTIYSKDEDGKALGNCVFTLRHQNGTKVGTYTTNGSGYVLIPNLEDGYYVVEQDSAPAGYVMTGSTQTVRVVAGQVVDITFINRAKPFIVAHGYISGTATGVPGATYEVWDVNNNLVQSVAAGADGTVVFEDLAPGTYVVRCVGVPDGYTLVTSAQTVTVTAKQAGVATFLFDKHSTIVVKATDSKTGDPLVGAIFQVRTASGTVVEQITTGLDGYAVSKTLTPGNYVVQLYWAPEGYVTDNFFQTVSVKNNETALVTFTQSQKSVIVIYATDSNAMGIPGVQFAVHDGITGEEVASLVSDESGVATTDPLTPGTYTVKELSAPEGYLLTTSYQHPVVLYGDVASYVRFPHSTQDMVYIETVDITTREAIGNAQYSVTKLNGDLVGNYTAGADGTAAVGPLEPGDYIVKQIVAPDGYRICTESQTIKVVSGRVLNLRFANYSMTGLVIEVIEQTTHDPIANVTFEVYDSDNKQVFHGTTDATGHLYTGNLPSGKYTIKQMTTPDGYTAVETTQVKEVTYDDVTTAVFQVKSNTSLVIELVDAETKDGLAGARFKVEDIDGNLITTVTTDESGTVKVSGLAAGKYMVSQVSAVDGYIMETNYQWAEVKTGVDPTYVKFTNARISGLTIRTLDRDTNAPLSGATFDIYEENGKLVQTVTTNSTGIATVTGLTPGNYRVDEVKGPDGYQIDTASQKVTITTYDNTTITFYHVANANVTLKAVSAAGDVLAGVTFNMITASGTFVGQFTTGANGLVKLPALTPGDYTVNIMTAPDGYILDTTPRTFTVRTNVEVLETFVLDQISGLNIRITEKQTNVGIGDVSVKITTLNGTLVGNYVSNEMGYINVELKPGKYIVYQTKVPEGYPIDTNPYNVEVKANVYTELELQLAVESHIRVQVVDAGTGAPVYNVSVEIADALTNNVVGRYKTDNEGFIYLNQVLNSTRYKLTMLTVPTGYTLDSVPKTVTVELGNTTDIKWPITGFSGQLTITTLSHEDNTLMGIFKGSRLSGAVYNITNASGVVVATIYGDGYGEAHSGLLEAGTYYVQMVEAPAGFMVNDQRVTVRISNKNDNVKMTVYCKSGDFSTTISAHGPTTVAAGNQAKFYFTDICNKSSINVNNFFYNIKVPTDAARAGTFYTGTWSGVATTYYVEYKTNMNDYRTLASGLNSKAQYSYDLSSISMGLGAGEYVTDIRVVFPVAVAGMHESMAPVLYVSVLSDVVDGYQLINRAECGCQGASSASVSGTGNYSINIGLNNISNSWTTSSSQSSTKVTNPKFPLPVVLPKTGY